MPKRGQKFITEFLVPNLNSGKFGTRLEWVDKEKSIFQIQWNHKSASKWTENDCEVFIEWDKKRGHYNPVDKEYYSKCKQRFRAVLYKFIKNNQITEITKDKNKKIYYLENGADLLKDVGLDGVTTSQVVFKKVDEVVNNLQNNTSQVPDSSTKRKYENYALKDHNYLLIKEKAALSNKKNLYSSKSTKKNCDFSDGNAISDRSEILPMEEMNYKNSAENQPRLLQNIFESFIYCNTVPENGFEEDCLLTQKFSTINDSELQNTSFLSE